MKLRTLSTLATTAGVLVGAANAQEPARLPAPSNQTLADTVAGKLTASGIARTADVTIMAVNGEITLTGSVKDEAQRAELIKQTKAIRGVAKVNDALAVPTGITQTRAQDVPTLPLSNSPSLGGSFGPMVNAPLLGIPPMAGMGVPNIDPIPLGGAGMGAGDMGAPPLPPNAWPTYAPHNNVSRVAYPQAYPYNAFPFIGPFYPFPKVPLGWRSVQLQWDDGHWWLGRTQAPQDYWRVRFW